MKQAPFTGTTPVFHLAEVLYRLSFSRIMKKSRFFSSPHIIASAINGVDPTGGRVSSRAAFSAAEDSRPPQRQSISLIAGAIERE
jgi:hypothetical protein